MLRRLFALPLIAVLWSVFGPAQVSAVPALTVHSARCADGLAVEVVGDPSTAATVVVLVPGVDTTAANFDRGLGGVQRRAPAWQARQLAARAAALRPPLRGRWRSSRGSATTRRTGVRLAAVRRGPRRGRRHRAAAVPVRRARPAGSCSSGTATAPPSSAGRRPPRRGTGGRVTDIVALGSPGMGVDRRRRPAHHAPASGPVPPPRLDPPPARRADPRRRPRHPPADPAFGALPLPVGGVAGHDGYFVPGTAFLDALAAIAIGDLDAAARHAH